MLPEDQLIRYAALGGREVAWSSVGSGPPIVLGGWWSSHLDLDWADPLFRRFVCLLAEHRTVIRYDRPGTGLSDRATPPAGTIEEELETLERLVDAVLPGERFTLLGASSGGLVAAAYAAAHADRADRLVLYGSYVRGRDIAPPSVLDTMLGVVQTHWGLGSRVLSDVFLPDGTAPERAAFAEFQRQSASAAVAYASLKAVYEFDGSELLTEVRIPTLVVHRREDRAIPFALGRDVAKRIPGAVFVELSGENHFPWRGDAEALARVILEFLGVATPEPAPVERADLTDRELEVLRLVALGLTDREIAAQLVLSPHTIHRHVANIRTKLGAGSRAAAVGAARDYLG